MTKRKDIHFRIEEKLLERFEVALHYEGLKKTDVLTHAIQQFCTKVESEKMNYHFITVYGMIRKR